MIRLFVGYKNFFFNPRSREGSDAVEFVYSNLTPFSIHAPARGATMAIKKPYMIIAHFNPRSREGSDTFYL